MQNTTMNVFPGLEHIYMPTAKEVAFALGTTENRVHQYRRVGLLKGTAIGKSWRFSIPEIMRFQKDTKGADLSNDDAIENYVRSNMNND